MGWVEEAILYPWGEPEADELLRVLVARYETFDEVRQLIKSAKAPKFGDVVFAGSINDLWRSVLDVAVKEGRLPVLLRYVRKALLPAETMALIDQVLVPRPLASHELTHLHRFDLHATEDECLATIAATSGHVGLAFYCPCEPVIDYVAARVATRLRPVNDHHKLNMIGGLQDLDVAISRLNRLMKSSLGKMNVFVALVVADCAAANEFWKEALKVAPAVAKHRSIVLIQIKSQIQALHNLQPLEPPSFERQHIETWCRSVLMDRDWNVAHVDHMLTAFLVGHEAARLDHELTYDRLNLAITLLRDGCCEDDFVTVWDQ